MRRPAASKAGVRARGEVIGISVLQGDGVADADGRPVKGSCTHIIHLPFPPDSPSDGDRPRAAGLEVYRGSPPPPTSSGPTGRQSLLTSSHRSCSSSPTHETDTQRSGNKKATNLATQSCSIGVWTSGRAPHLSSFSRTPNHRGHIPRAKPSQIPVTVSPADVVQRRAKAAKYVSPSGGSLHLLFAAAMGKCLEGPPVPPALLLACRRASMRPICVLAGARFQSAWKPFLTS